jgi:hypothetical protein
MVKLGLFVSLIAVAALVLFVATQLTFFVVQPIGALPEGRTLLIWRLNTMRFIDSADAWCERQMGSVKLLCRGVVLGKVAEQDGIIARLPYSETLYLISTGGRTYSR